MIREARDVTASLFEYMNLTYIEKEGMLKMDILLQGAEVAFKIL